MKNIFATTLLLLAGILSLNAQTIVTSDQSVNEELSKWRISASVGASYQAGTIPDGLGAVERDQAKALQWGLTYDADVTCYFFGTFGLGVKYNSFRTSHQQNIVATLNSGETQSGLLSDKINIWFVGPMLSSRDFTKGRSCWIMNAGLGYMGYHDDAVLIDSFTLNGGTLGVMAEGGYELALTKTLKLHALFSVYAGTLRSVTITEGGLPRPYNLDKDKQISLTHLDLKLGLSFNF